MFEASEGGHLERDLRKMNEIGIKLEWNIFLFG